MGEGFQRHGAVQVPSRSPPTPQDTIEDSQGTLRIGAWLNFQRTRKNQGKLEPDALARLAQLFERHLVGNFTEVAVFVFGEEDRRWVVAVRS